MLNYTPVPCLMFTIGTNTTWKSLCSNFRYRSTKYERKRWLHTQQ